MGLAKLTLLIFLFNIAFLESAVIQCSTSFDTGNNTTFCYYYKKKPLSWSDAYNQCLTRTANAILVQIFSKEQFDLLKTVNSDGATLFWLGANNFASFLDFQWHWLDGSVVDSSAITWCPNSTYEVAIGTHCAAYDSTLQCVNNYLCDTLLPAPCVSTTNGISTAAKNSLMSRQITSAYICTSSFGGAYANWWTYSSLLLNWFILFCFFLYLCNRFTLNQNTLTITVTIAVLTFIMIIIYAILWGVQYNNIIQIPVIIVIMGSLASAFLFVVLFIVLNDRTRVQRYMASTILIISTMVVEFFLLLGLILCMAYCSGYLTLAPTSLDKDVIAALLATLSVAISILFYTGILQVLVNTGQERVNAVRPAAEPSIPITKPQVVVPQRPAPAPTAISNHRPTLVPPVKKPSRKTEPHLLSMNVFSMNSIMINQKMFISTNWKVDSTLFMKALI